MVLGESPESFIYQCLLWCACSSCTHPSMWAVMAQAALTSISKSIFILCCTDLRNWIQIFWGRRTDSQIALSWGWHGLSDSKLLLHLIDQQGLCLGVISSEKYFGFCCICDALYGGCNAVCNLESCELCSPWTAMVHLQTGRSKELFINSKFIFSPLRKSLFAPSVGNKIPKELIWKLDTVENTELFCYFFLNTASQ